MTDEPFDDSDQRVPQQVIDTIKTLSAWTGTFEPDHLLHPAGDSRAAQDLHAVASDDVRRGRITRGLELSGMRIHSARSCLDAMVACHLLPAPDAACHSLARVTIETCAWTRWLCDQNLTTDERIARVAADELHGLRETESILREMGMSSSGESSFKATLHSAGIVPARRPGSTQAVGMALGGEIDNALRTAYRFLCAYPHASSHLFLNDSPAFTDLALPLRDAARIYMWTFHEHACYVGWPRLDDWIAWAEPAKANLASR